jgi:hypothetical protein
LEGVPVIFKTVVIDSLIFAGIANVYLFFVMITTSPRVWGYSDYPDVVKDKVAPPTRNERWTAALVGLPWFAFLFGYPFVAFYRMKAGIGDEIPYATAFVFFFAMFQSASLVDLVVLDWLIVSTITPSFVIIPGSDAADYKDFSHHYKGHARAFLALTLLALVFAAVGTYL